MLRRVRLDLHPFAAAGIAAAALGLLAWSAATTSYALFRDDVLIEIMQRHAVAQRAGDDEAARLKAEIARISSKSMVERETLTGRIDQLARQQADLERRHDALSAAHGGTTPAPAAPAPVPPAGLDLRLNGAKPQDHSSLDSLLPRPDPAAMLVKLANGYARINAMQSALADKIEGDADREQRRLGDLFLAVGLPIAAPVKAGMGGPFIPLPGINRERREDQATRIEGKLRALNDLREAASALPVRHPARGADQTSGFGGRPDPFFNAPAFHAGIDFALAEGAPVRSTGAGRIMQAGWNGGYGLMVEIDHGRGLITRYAHLSTIAVREGRNIAPGEILGRAGSTGRSTGSHLHYETRVNGSAVDPSRFISAGRLLGEAR